MGTTIVLAALVIAMNLLVDITYKAGGSRITLARGGLSMAGFNLFQLNTDKIPDLNTLGGRDFETATGEKTWWPRARRLLLEGRRAPLPGQPGLHGRAVPVPGHLPVLLPGPGIRPLRLRRPVPGPSSWVQPFSKTEETVKVALQYGDKIFATSLMPGSSTSLVQHDLLVHRAGRHLQLLQ